LGPQLVQQQQTAAIDIMFIRPLSFLILVVKPLDMTFCQLLASFDTSLAGAKSAGTLAKALTLLINVFLSRGFIISVIRCDGEKGVSAIAPLIHAMGHETMIAGAGAHVPVVERKIQFIKEKVRSYITSSHFVMPSIVLIYCVYFSVGCVNNHISAGSMDNCLPRQRFTGRKLDTKIDARFSFGEYCHATVPTTSNSMTARTDPCICLLSSMNLTGSVKMLDLNSFTIVTRDNFMLLPMPASVIAVLNKLAFAEGNKQKFRFTGGQDIVIDIDGVNSLPNAIIPADTDFQPMSIRVQEPPPHPETTIGGDIHTQASLRQEGTQEGTQEGAQEATATQDTPGRNTQDTLDGARHYQDGVRDIIASVEHDNLVVGTGAYAIVSDDLRGDIPIPLVPLLSTSKGLVLHISVKRALRDHPGSAKIAMAMELRQMLDKKVWTPVHVTDLSHDQRRAIIRSSMFLKEKYLLCGAFEKLKARLVAGGGQQDKTLYSNLSAATAATNSVFIFAALAAKEKRIVCAVDITGACLNANMSNEVSVYMRLDKTMTDMLISMNNDYADYTIPNGGCIVRLDKALYGRVESAALWAHPVE
jgi:hypothetical protein